MTQADPSDPLKDSYGDSDLIASREATQRVWSHIEACSPGSRGAKVGTRPTGSVVDCLWRRCKAYAKLSKKSLTLYGAGDAHTIQSHQASGDELQTLSIQVLLRGRVHAVRGKGKSAFLVLRQRTSTMQVNMLLKHFLASI